VPVARPLGVVPASGWVWAHASTGAAAHQLGWGCPAGTKQQHKAKHDMLMSRTGTQAVDQGRRCIQSISRVGAALKRTKQDMTQPDSFVITAHGAGNFARRGETGPAAPQQGWGLPCRARGAAKLLHHPFWHVGIAPAAMWVCSYH
jgi:hypothetical protein